MGWDYSKCYRLYDRCCCTATHPALWPFNPRCVTLRCASTYVRTYVRLTRRVRSEQESVVSGAGELTNLVASQAPIHVEDQCLTKMLDGDQALAPDLADLPNPFVMSQHMHELLQGFDPQAAPEVIQGTQAFEWLPDLVDGQAGMPKKCNAYQVGPVIMYARFALA